MRKLLLTLLLTLTGILATNAQTTLGIDKFFAKYGHAKGCKMVEMHDAELKGYKLKTYKSLVYKTAGRDINNILAEDKKRAKKIREVVNNGIVVSGYYQMESLSGGINRYILFSRGAKGGGTVIYIEGTLKPDDIMEICYRKKK